MPGAPQWQNHIPACTCQSGNILHTYHSDPHRPGKTKLHRSKEQETLNINPNIATNKMRPSISTFQNCRKRKHGFQKAVVKNRACRIIYTLMGSPISPSGLKHRTGLPLAKLRILSFLSCSSTEVGVKHCMSLC